ncbi:MAG: GNAT family N-acetyltransferase [Mycobacteriales bacterium]
MPNPPSLENEFVRLEPLTPEHSEPLLAIVDEDLWAGMVTPLPTGIQRMSAHIGGLLADPNRSSFVVIDQLTGGLLGSTCLYDYVPAQARVELGNTFYARSVWGGPTNPACKLLLFEHAFNQLGVHRVALRCDTRNVRSIAAIQKLGAIYEGTLRGHRIAADGTTSDTKYFSVLATEWPGVRRDLQARLVALGTGNTSAGPVSV